jgi:hypothetical protein
MRKVHLPWFRPWHVILVWSRFGRKTVGIHKDVSIAELPHQNSNPRPSSWERLFAVHSCLCGYEGVIAEESIAYVHLSSTIGNSYRDTAIVE